LGFTAVGKRSKLDWNDITVRKVQFKIIYKESINKNSKNKAKENNHQNPIPKRESLGRKVFQKAMLLIELKKWNKKGKEEDRRCNN